WSDHGLMVNDYVYVMNNSVAGYNGYFIVTNVSNTTSFDYAVTTCPTGSGTGGTIFKAPSWLPVAVTSCGVSPNLGGTLSMSDDGSTIVGSAVYSTCGSFMSGGFVWTAASNQVLDWY